MTISWKKFVIASGRVAELNQAVAKELDIFVEEFPNAWPSAVFIGQDLLTTEDSKIFERATIFWGGYVGELYLGIIPGDRIEIHGRRL